jgi:DNA mismatch endonuclease (patch repair protein)
VSRSSESNLTTTYERSRQMARIRTENTNIEVLVRKQLHALGFRYTLHSTKMVGRPDIVLPHWHVVIFVNGCFWHWHGCSLSYIPKTNRSFWSTKLEKNRSRDRRTLNILKRSGWSVAEIWQCALNNRKDKSEIDRPIESLAQWIVNPNHKSFIEITGNHCIETNRISSRRTISREV